MSVHIDIADSMNTESSLKDQKFMPAILHRLSLADYTLLDLLDIDISIEFQSTHKIAILYYKLMTYGPQPFSTLIPPLM